MKKGILVIAIAVVLALSCTGSTKGNNGYSLPQFTSVAEGSYGTLLKYKDGENLIYIYERSGGAASISVVTPCNK